jgi:dihydrofolate reductase
MINALFAVDQFGGMGFNGTMPWPHNPADLANFKSLTMGHVVVMGRRTWDDNNMPKPLKGRTTYVATTRPAFHTATISGNLKEEILKLEKLHSDKIIWVIGGPDLLSQCEGIFNRLYLTHYKNSYKVDTKINMKQFMSGWHPVAASHDPANNFTTAIYEHLFGRYSTGT